MIQPHPSAPEGSVTFLADYQPESFASTSAILCRNVAPLVSFAFSLIQRDIGCRILGREIGASLVTLIKKCKTEDLDELIHKLDKLRQREIEKALANFNDSAVAAAEDKYDCLNLFIASSDSVPDLIRRIESLFDDRNKGLLTLATVHKSKGLEWETVFILDKALMPSRFAKTPSARQQETNLQYVATTRAKLHLIYINSGNWKKEMKLESPAALASQPSLHPPDAPLCPRCQKNEADGKTGLCSPCFTEIEDQRIAEDKLNNL